MEKAKFSSELIAPCRMNCGICKWYLAYSRGIPKKKGKVIHCPGCFPRRKNCFVKRGCKMLRKKAFTTKAESVSRKRKDKSEYLNGGQTRQLMKQLNAFFEVIVEVPRIRIGKRQTIETLINEEALLLTKFLRGERKSWVPRIAVL